MPARGPSDAGSIKSALGRKQARHSAKHFLTSVAVMSVRGFASTLLHEPSDLNGDSCCRGNPHLGHVHGLVGGIHDATGQHVQVQLLGLTVVQGTLLDNQIRRLHTRMGQQRNLVNVAITLNSSHLQ